MASPTAYPTKRKGTEEMKCFDCHRELEVGDRYIKAPASVFAGVSNSNTETDDIIADIFGGVGGEVVFCEDCTVDGGDFALETVYGDEVDA
jgi:hypothetical protein